MYLQVQYAFFYQPKSSSGFCRTYWEFQFGYSVQHACNWMYHCSQTRCGQLTLNRNLCKGQCLVVSLTVLLENSERWKRVCREDMNVCTIKGNMQATTGTTPSPDKWQELRWDWLIGRNNCFFSVAVFLRGAKLLTPFLVTWNRSSLLVQNVLCFAIK